MMLAIYDNNRDDELHLIEFILVDDASQAQLNENCYQKAVTQYCDLIKLQKKVKNK